MSLQTGNQDGCENRPIRFMTTPKTAFKYGCGHKSDWPIFTSILIVCKDIEILCSKISCFVAMAMGYVC